MAGQHLEPAAGVVAYQRRATQPRASLAQRIGSAPPGTFFVGSAIFHYLGPAFAVLLFARVDPLGVSWLRIASAAAIYAAWRRPWRRLAGIDAAGATTLVAMGGVLAVMNICFYLAIARLPLGTVAAIEFLPVVALAALGARTKRNAGALVGAVAGVYLLTDVRLEAAPVGHRVAQREHVGGIDGLAIAMLIAAVVVTPIGGWSAAPEVVNPIVLVAGIGVGFTSSVIPYVCDQLAMARMRRSTYALFVALLPATATVVGIVVLRQFPSVVEAVAVGLVVAAVAVYRE
jgi:inner membrane transporter RhtA